MLTGLHEFEKKVSESWPWEKWKSFLIVVAVSGGADSVALALALRNIALKASTDSPLRQHWLHVNHQARPSADNDQQFVEALAKKSQVPCTALSFDSAALNRSGIGTEAAMRDARYDRFEKVANQLGARYIAMGHHRDDQVETVIQRIFRGTGIAGLCGIPVSRNLSETVTIIRPLLKISRAEILKYLGDIQQSFCVDESNEDPSFKRNQIRNVILPFLKEHFENDIDEAILKLSGSSAETERYLRELTNPLVDIHVEFSTDGFSVCQSWMENADPFVVRRVIVESWKQMQFPLRDIGATHWNQLAELGQNKPSNDVGHRLTLPGKIVAELKGKRLVVKRVE